MGRSILIIENEIPSAQKTEAILNSQGYACAHVQSGKAALEHMLNGETIDLVLTDIELGHGIDGTETARRVLEFMDIPVVFLTVHATKIHVDRAKSVTNYGYVLKSSGEFVLLETIEMAFRLCNTQKRLKRNEKRFSLAMEAVQDGIWDWNLETNEVYYSPGYLKIIGYTEVEIPSNPDFWINHVHSEDRDYVLKANKDVIENRAEKIDVEFRMNTKHNEWRWVLGRGRAVERDENGRATRLVGTHSDITNRKETEQLLAKNQEKYRLMAENTSDVICHVNEKLQPIYISPSSKRVFGYSPKEFKKVDFFFMVHPEDRPCLIDKMQASRRANTENESRITFRIYKKNGEQCWIEATSKKIYSQSGVFEGAVMVHRDISRQKGLEKQLSESEQHFRSVVESSQDYIVILDGQLNLIYMNSSLKRNTGYTEDDLKNISDLNKHTHPEDKQKIKEQIQYDLDQKSRQGDSEFRIITKENKVLWVQAKSTNYRDADNNLERIFVYLRDVTQYKDLIFSLNSALEEKRTLMKELNHRVKNSLFLVSSLVRLKEQNLGGQVDLSDLYQQITAIQTVHELLQEANTVSNVPVHSYIERLVTNILTQRSGAPIYVEKSIDKFELSSKTATSIGIVITELTLNALKHGIDSDADPRIEITLKKNNNGKECFLYFFNNGKAFPKDISLDNPETLGLRLITASIKQIDGTIELKRSPSPAFKIKFPIVS